MGTWTELIETLGDWAAPGIFPCTVLMAELMPLLMASTAVLIARWGFGGLRLLSSGVGGRPMPVAWGMVDRAAVGLLWAGTNSRQTLTHTCTHRHCCTLHFLNLRMLCRSGTSPAPRML